MVYAVEPVYYGHLGTNRKSWFSRSIHMIWDHSKVCGICRCPYFQVSLLTGFTVKVTTYWSVLLLIRYCHSRFLFPTGCKNSKRSVRNGEEWKIICCMQQVTLMVTKPRDIHKIKMLFIFNFWLSANTGRHYIVYKPVFLTR